MNKETVNFMKEVIKFVVLVILVALVINYIYYNHIIQKKIISRTEQEYNEYIKSIEKKEINYVFFGDSLTNIDINPKYIPDSFNFASNGQNYIMAYYRLNKLIKHDKIKINYIVLQIDPQTFSDDRYEGMFLFDEENLWFWNKYIPYSEIIRFTHKSNIAIFIESNFPFIGSGSHLGALAGPQGITKLYRGWTEFDGDYYFYYTNRTEYTLLFYKAYFNGAEVKIHPLAKEYLNKIINLSKENNISIVFIKYPLTKGFYDLLIRGEFINQTGFYDQLFETINKNTDSYSFFDYQTIYFNKTEYFGDPTHLNINGSTWFSMLVSKDLANIGKNKILISLNRSYIQ